MKNKIKIFLDDVRTPISDEWTIVRNYEEFVDIINLYKFSDIEEISLDHDLGETSMIEYYTNVKNNYSLNYNNIEEKTGMDCCRYLVNRCLNTNEILPKIFIHSANPIGSANMMGYINNYLKNCNLPQTCVRKEIEHSIHESHLISPEERKKRWDKSKK